MRAGAEIDEVAVAIERDSLVVWNVLDDVELEFARLGSLAERSETPFFAELQRLVARDFHALEG